MKAKIGYFIPEFPGQTHIFFWRERQVLADLDVLAELVSTRRPPREIASHSWGSEAEQETDYLMPFSASDFVAALTQILAAGPAGWSKCLGAIARAQGVSLKQRLRLAALVPVAGKLAQIMKTKGWSHLHVHSCADTANIAMFASFLTGIPYSMTLHGPTLEVYGPNQAQKWQHSSFGLVVSERLFEDIQNKLAGFLPADVVVAPMGVNLDQIKRHQPYRPWREGNPCHIFACGRLNPIKGHKFLIESVELLRQRGFDARLQIAGEDEQGGSGYHQELEQFIRDRNLSDVIELLGAVSEARIRQGLEDAHIFALASLNEGVPVAVMEAMAMEMPVIVNDVGGTAELVTDGVDGILLQPEQPKAMADAIEKVLKDEALALQLSERSRQKVTEKFSHRRSAELLVDFLAQLDNQKLKARGTYPAPPSPQTNETV